MHLPDTLLLCVLGAVSILPFVFLNSESENSDELFLGKYKIPKITNDPINIDSNKVQEENNLAPLSIHGTFSDKVIVVNTGRIVEVFLDQEETTSSVKGGVLKDDTYVFKKIIYFWTNNTSGITGSTFDNKGYPLENLGIFYNKKYGTFENSLKRRDGLAILHFDISVCSDRNRKFDKYEEKLKEIQRAGSTTLTSLGTAINWFAGNGIMPPNSAYYAYPGSYTDEMGRKYYCSTVIILPHLPEWCISKKQYEETFGSFKNFLGKPLTNPKSRFPRNMPVVRAKGILNSNTP